MSSTTGQISSETHSFDQTMTNLKQGMNSAKTMQAEVSGKVVQTAKGLSDFNQASAAAFVQAGQILATGSQDLCR